jgi:hypothetical protein
MNGWRSNTQSMAAYRSSSSASSTAKSTASVVSANRAAVPNLESGRNTRCATMASTQSRWRQGLEAIRSAIPNRSIVPWTARTWPQGRERSTEKNSLAATNRSPLSTERKAASASGGSAERLASVRLTVRLPSRWSSRSNTAGGELRLGTTSMYMGIQ